MGLVVVFSLNLSSFSLFIAIMEVKQIFVTLLLFLWIIFAIAKHENFVVSHAIIGVVNEHYGKITSKSPGQVTIILIGYETKEFLAFMAALLKVKTGDIKIVILKSEISEENFKKFGFFYLLASQIVFFDSVARFKAVGPRIKWASDQSKKNEHLVHVPNLTASDIIETFSNGFDIDEVSFLINETGNSVDLVTGYMFTEQKCRVLKHNRINRFNVKWEKSIFFPKKYKNFHGCKLTTNVPNIGKRNHELCALIFKEMLNAELEVVTIGSEYMCLRCDLNAKVVTMFPYPLTVVVSNLVYSHNIMFAVPPGEPYTDLERMFMMFSFELWIAIGLTLIIGFLVTLSLHLVSEKIRIFIAGRDIQSPTMNFISIFLTGGQVRAPGRNFARFLLILFVMWSLIIRTCHQSMLFEFMQADLRRPPLKTLDEFFESDLTYHGNYDAYGRHSFDDEYLRERMAMPSTT